MGGYIKIDFKEMKGTACTEFAWLKFGTELVLKLEDNNLHSP
jgi:hypothetical protein